MAEDSAGAGAPSSAPIATCILSVSLETWSVSCGMAVARASAPAEMAGCQRSGSRAIIHQQNDSPRPRPTFCTVSCSDEASSDSTVCCAGGARGQPEACDRRLVDESFGRTPRSTCSFFRSLASSFALAMFDGPSSIAGDGGAVGR